MAKPKRKCILVPLSIEVHKKYKSIITDQQSTMSDDIRDHILDVIRQNS